MKKILVLPLIAVGTGVDIVMSAWLMMATSGFLHTNWWSAIPAFNFGSAALIGILLMCFSYITNLHGHEYTWSAFFFRVFVGLGVVPFVAPWVLGEMNNVFNLGIPDITYGTVFVLALIGFGIAAINAAISVAVEAITALLLE